MTDPQATFLRDYFVQLASAVALNEAVEAKLYRVRDLFVSVSSAGGVVRLVGNGGSMAIASHIATDLTKNAGVLAATYSDAPFLTCLANDYGHEHALAHALRLTANPTDVLVAISSSGRSQNIVNAAVQARQMGIPVIAFTGFARDNPVGESAELGLWVDSNSYNIVETVHQFWLMSVVDMLIGTDRYSAARVVDRRQP